jgi:hypothetical protein
MLSLLLALTLQALAVQAVVYSATFTWYGQGDERGSPNCQKELGACGFYTSVCAAFVCIYRASLLNNNYSQASPPLYRKTSTVQPVAKDPIAANASN